MHYIFWYRRESMNDTLEELYEKYNKDGILCLHFGPAFKLVTVGDFDIVKEHFKKDEINFRWRNCGNANFISKSKIVPPPSLRQADDRFMKFQRDIRKCRTGNEGIVNASGHKWQEQRRFMLTTLRDFGFGKSSMEEMINEEMEYFCTYMDEESSSKGVINVQSLFNIAVLNILWRIVAGERYDYRDPKLRELMKIVNDAVLNATPKFSMAVVFPKLREIYPSIDTHMMQAKWFGEIKNFLVSKIDEHVTTYESSNARQAFGCFSESTHELYSQTSSRDYIDAFLSKMELNKADPDSSFNDLNGKEYLTHSLVDLFFAGSETTSSTLTWAMLFMIRDTDLQERIRKEICSVLGEDTMPKLTDRYGIMAKLPQ